MRRPPIHAASAALACGLLALAVLPVTAAAGSRIDELLDEVRSRRADAPERVPPASPEEVETLWAETRTHRIKLKIRGDRILGRWDFEKKTPSPGAAPTPEGPQDEEAPEAALAVSAEETGSPPSEETGGKTALATVGRLDASAVPPLGLGVLALLAVAVPLVLVVRRREAAVDLARRAKDRVLELAGRLPFRRSGREKAHSQA